MVVAMKRCGIAFDSTNYLPEGYHRGGYWKPIQQPPFFPFLPPSVFWDQDEGVIYYNAKHTDSFWKIRKGDQKILWAVGRYGNMTLLDKNGDPVTSLFH